jgi:hypothetical protein
MALITCEDCGKSISDRAPSCPHCGAPSAPANKPSKPPPTQQPTATAINPAKKGDQYLGLKVFLAIVGTISVLIILGALTTTTTGDRSATTKSCFSNWIDCEDNRDMAKMYKDWTAAKVACRFEAEDRVKYGKPEWPSGYFSNFYPGTNYSTTGIATLIELDARFQNGFGAMVRSSVHCQYDLRAKKVINVTISAR